MNGSKSRLSFDGKRMRMRRKGKKRKEKKREGKETNQMG